MKMKAFLLFFCVAMTAMVISGCLHQQEKEVPKPAAEKPVARVEKPAAKVEKPAKAEKAEKPKAKKKEKSEAFTGKAAMAEAAKAEAAKEKKETPAKIKPTIEFSAGKVEKPAEKEKKEAPVPTAALLGELTEMPEFPWPPPRYSAIANVPIELFKERIEEPTLGYVANKLENALDNAGYSDRSYYYIPNGFALITRLERINQDGTSCTEDSRWITGPQPLKKFSISSYIKSLFTAPPGYYRIIVFAVTDKPFAPSTKKADSKNFYELLIGGANMLPEEIAMLEYTQSYRCTALIYEFKQKQTDKDPILVSPSHLPAKIHLSKSKIWEGLKQ